MVSQLSPKQLQGLMEQLHPELVQQYPNYSNAREVVDVPYEYSKAFRSDDNKKSGQWKIYTILLIFSLMIFAIFFGMSTYLLQNDLKNEKNKLVEKTSDLDIVVNELQVFRNPYMNGIGFDFFDNREPTDNELFLAEESLNLCHNPTYSQLIYFIEKNDLDDYDYSDYYWFDCDEYSYTLINDSRNRGFRAGQVTIYPKKDFDDYDEDDVTHSIVVFNTSDRGLIFVEPQLDSTFTLSEFNKMQKNNCYYAEDDGYTDYLYYIEMDFNHYTIDWFYWYHPYGLLIYTYTFDLFQMWNLFKNEYPNFDFDYSSILMYKFN